MTIPLMQLHTLSNHGTSEPVTARTLVQGTDLTRGMKCSEEQRNEMNACIYNHWQHLVRCVTARNHVAREVAAGRKRFADGLVTQAGGRVIHCPSIPDLRAHVEDFLQSAKLAIADLGELVKPIYGKSFNHKFHKFLEWAEKEFGAADGMTRVLTAAQPTIKQIIDMRNAVDHPNDQPRQRLDCSNFSVATSPTALIEPTWNLTTEPKRLLLPDLSDYVDDILSLGEALVLSLFLKNRAAPFMQIEEVPASMRDPGCPIRYRVVAAL